MLSLEASGTAVSLAESIRVTAFSSLSKPIAGVGDVV